MEIQILSPTQAQPLPPVQWNYEEVKQWVQDGLSRYKGVVYDETQISLAKTDRANLNKLAAAIDAKRKEMKAVYLQPYAEFEAQAKELTELVKTQVAEIDAQVKAFDNFRKEEKQAQIIAEIYSPMIGNLAELVPYERLHNSRWLNVTMSMGAIGEEMSRTIGKIVDGLKAIDNMVLDQATTERVKSVFLENFDLAAAISEKVRIETARAQYERYKAAQQAQDAPRVLDASDPDAFAKARPGDVIRFGGPGCETATAEPQEGPAINETILTVTFRIHVTKAQLDALGAFMKANGIKPERV